MSSSAALLIAALAEHSEIRAYHWPHRGPAPAGYIKGLAVMFGRCYCGLKRGDKAAQEMARAASGNQHLDALVWYADQFDAFGLDNSIDGVDTLRHLFVLLTGLGMRESSGRYCEGRDMSANNTTAETAEAGLFQVSHDSMKANPLLSQLTVRYEGSTDFQDIFREGVACGTASWKNWGEGEGANFQQLSKVCPAFAVEYAALGLRYVRTQWGPINLKAAELRLEVDRLFHAVQKLIDVDDIKQV